MSYFGGNIRDELQGIAIDSEDNIYLGGDTESLIFPTTPGCFQDTNKNLFDGFLMKLNKNYELIWCTYVGSPGWDNILGIDIAPDNSIWYCGDSYLLADGYPVTEDAFQKENAGGTIEANFGHFSKDGYRIYITLFGGNMGDSFNKIKIDKESNVYLCGESNSPNFPRTTNNNYFNVFDAVLVKFDNKNNLVYSTNFGGSDIELCHGIGVDSEGNVLITGATNSYDFPVTNAVQKSKRDTADIFITKFDKDFNITWSTFFGGNGIDCAQHLLIDDSNNVVIKGFTTSKDLYITKNAFQNQLIGNSDHFVLKIDKNCNIIWNTYFGGSDSIVHYYYLNWGRNGISLDSNENIIICDITTSPDMFITTNATQKSLRGKSDAFILSLDRTGKPVYSTYFGGYGEDCGYDCKINSKNEIVIVGYTYSKDLATTKSAFQDTISGDADGFILELKPIIKDTCDETEFNYFSFHGDEDIVNLANSSRYSNLIRLTKSEVSRIGAIWYKFPLPVKNGFETEFKFKISNGYNAEMADSSLPGADGIAFVIQNSDLSAIGGNGGYIGYDPIPNSLAVEYDLFGNDEKQIEVLNDPNGNHVAVMSMGKEPNSSNHKSGAELGINQDIIELKSNNTYYYSKIDYNIDPGNMRIYLTDNENDYGEPVLVINNLDLVKLLELKDGEWAYVGFTSATGSSYQNHDILSWEFCPKPTNSILNGIEDEEPAIDFGDDIIFPNPADDILFLNTEKFDIKSVQIIDLTGRAVYSSNNIAISEWIKISGLAAGCWLLKIETTDGKILVEKFLKK